MQLPEGYVQEEESHLVYPLNRSLYGLKQAPRCWNMTFSDFMKSNGFKSNSVYPCIFITKKNDKIIIVAVHVDGLIILTKAPQEMQHTKDMFANQFNMKDLGKIRYCLGNSVEQDERNS